MRGKGTLSLKVGLFIFVSLLILVVFVFFLGEGSNLFKKRYTVVTTFTNAGGLIEGATVRLSGVRIGSVKSISFPKETDKNFIVVEMEVSEDGIRRIGPDSVATIRTEGLLGDKYIEIRRGQEVLSRIPERLEIKSYTPPEFEKLLGQSEELIDNIVSISRSLDEIVKAFGREENIENISRTIASIRRTLEAIETEPGVLHTLIYGRKDGSGGGFESTLEKLDETITALNRLISDIRGGNGLISTLIYDKELAFKVDQAISNINSITRELGDREGFVAELEKTVKNLKEITESIKEGEGTLGALVKDPTLYYRLTGVLGEAERSRFIRAAIMYMMENRGKGSK
jgi:phospholipid/cholesterol/gamma-HCH transport system substrate-binding protein